METKLVKNNGDSILKIKTGTVMFNNGAAFVGEQKVKLDYSTIGFNEIPTVIVSLADPSVYAKSDTRVYANSISKTECMLCANHINTAFGGACKLSYIIIGK